jgi:cytochrome b
MNTTSAFPAEPAQPEARAAKVLIWDAPVRVFHWLLALSFAGAWLTAESERWRLVHVSLGYTMVGLVAFRIVWGLIGTRHARFGSFVRGPAVVTGYVKGLLRGKSERHVGHNPLGALAIVALLGLTVVIGYSGWATFAGAGGRWLESLHEGAANLMLAVAGLHVAGVLLASWLHRESLIGAMFTGLKRGGARDGIARSWRWIGALLLIAVMSFWTLQWQTRPAADPSGAVTASPSRDDD